jgi:hypothetical protein
MQVYALTSSQSPHETLDLFLTREAAEAELREILQDEPNWKDVSIHSVPYLFCRIARGACARAFMHMGPRTAAVTRSSARQTRSLPGSAARSLRHSPSVRQPPGWTRATSHFGGVATIVSASTTFRRFAAKGLSRISLPCRSDYVSTFRGDECRSATSLPCPRRTTFLRLATP